MNKKPLPNITKCLSGLSGEFERKGSRSICSSTNTKSLSKESTSKKSSSHSVDQGTSFSSDNIPCICICGVNKSENVEKHKKPDRTMLITGFGMRNHESLQRALLDDEQRREMILHQYHDEGEEYVPSSKHSGRSSDRSAKYSADASSQSASDISDPNKKLLALEYLMGLTTEPAEEASDLKLAPDLESTSRESEEKGSGTLAMRKAQKYLRTHHTFEFFQFLIAHLLSALPDNPINFLLGLLDKCLIYRTGLGFPPLLYEKPHLEQLFYLMDRMRTGFIELEQYKTAMTTLGICSYEKNPPLTSCGMVAKEVFIDEAYNCLTDIFQDMIRRRGDNKSSSIPSLVTPPPTEISVGLSREGGQ